MRQYTPRAYAAPVNDLLASQRRCAIWARPGSGKTVMALTHLDTLYNVLGETRPSLVLAPLRVARDTWTTEARKWKHLEDLEVVPVLGTPAQRKAALQREAPVYVTNYEQVPWLVEHYGKRWPFRTVVADESTRLKSYRIGGSKGRRARALASVQGLTDNWVNLTGTPSPNGLIDLWGQTWFLDKGERLGTTFGAFQSRWFRPIPAGDERVLWRPHPHSQDEIQARLADICLTIDPADWFPLDEVSTNLIEVTLPARARAHYEELEAELFTQLTEGHKVEVFNKSSLTIKCLQAANGALYREGNKDWTVLHDEKLDALQELIESNDSPVLVGVHFKHDAARIAARFPGALHLSDAADLDRARRGEGTVWIGSPASIGLGVDGLQNHCNTVAFFSLWWDLEQHSQFIDRVGPVRQSQLVHPKPVVVHYILAENTTDQVVKASLEGKADSQTLLMNYMKSKGRKS